MYKHNLKISSFLFFLFGVHPEKNRILQQFLFFLVLSANATVITLTLLLFLYKEDMTLKEVFGCLEAVLLLVHGMYKQVALYVQRPRMRELLQRLANFRDIESINDDSTEAACRRTIRNLNRLSRMYVVGGLSAVFGFAIWPTINNVMIFVSCVPPGIPNGCLVVLQLYVYFVGVISPCVSSSFFYMTLVFLATIQFQILNYDVGKLFPTEGVNEGERAVNKRIKNWVDYHNFLLDFVELFNETFSVLLFLYIGIITLSCCMELFIASMESDSSNIIKYYTYIFILFFEFIAYYCLPAQMLTNEADKICHSIWASDWKANRLTPSVRAAVSMILMRSQEMVVIKAAVLNANVETCFATLKTISSYYMFLKTMTTKEE